jgi:hypothetical protein
MRKQAVVLFVSLVVVIALPAAAFGAIRIKKIAFDPPGADTGTNSHINKEWVLIKNTGDNTKQLQGWKLLDRGPDHRYRFGALSLAPGDFVKLHSGSGSHTVTSGCGGDCAIHHYYWGQDNYVWNNGGDRATLKNSAGNVVDRCRYGAAADSPKRC